jgi:hypothetical protein
MKYLIFENVGEAPIPAITTFGVSLTDSAQCSGTIGEFGTGSKQAICVCLRHNLYPIIHTGKVRATFQLQEFEVNDGLTTGVFNKVKVRLEGRTSDGAQIARTEDTGFVLEVGRKDWTCLEQGLREFTTNTIDRTIRENLSTGGTLVPKVYLSETLPIPQTGLTRIIVPVNDEVILFYAKLSESFLHFEHEELLEKTVLPKLSSRDSLLGLGAHFYRMGCLFTFEGYEDLPQSVFDYNFGSGLKVNESRTAYKHEVLNMIGTNLDMADTEIKVQLLKALGTGENYLENQLSEYYFASWYTDRKNSWLQAWDLAFGDSILTTTSTESSWAERRDIKYKQLPACGLTRHLSGVGIRTATLAREDVKNLVLEEPPKEVVETLSRVTNYLKRYIPDLVMPTIWVLAESETADFSATRYTVIDNTLLLTHNCAQLDTEELLKEVLSSWLRSADRVLAQVIIDRLDLQ